MLACGVEIFVPTPEATLNEMEDDKQIKLKMMSENGGERKQLQYESMNRPAVHISDDLAAPLLW